MLWVVKVGSQILMEQGPLFIQSLAADIAELRKSHGVSVVVVSSGAIASARSRLKTTWKTLPEKQALSALGQPMIMNYYNVALNAHGLMGAQVLLTYKDLKQAVSRKNFANTIRQLRKWEIVPILNENDAIATEEIRFGDNDLLSALVACELKAKKLILMTDVEGVYDRHPKERDAILLKDLAGVPKKLMQVSARAPKSDFGSGGIVSKLQAAERAAKCKVVTHVVRGSRAQVLLSIARGENPGTCIKPARSR